MRKRDIAGEEDEIEEDFTSGAIIDSKNCAYCEEDEEEITREVFNEMKENQAIAEGIEGD
jgi:hypothetical protein